jgi:surface protein
MVQMFYGANLFNQPLANWDVSKVTTMTYLFSDANSFNQSLANWTLNPNVNLTLMLSYAGLNCTNYSATLIGWAANPATPSGRSLGAHGRQYGTSAVAARTYLDIDKGWTFTSDVASGATCSLVLPVEWLSFNGEQSDRVIFLNWQTALETGNLGFQVERSTDGSHWQPIGFVPARPENEDKPFYTFTDEKALDEFPACRTLYYRLRQKDQDGGEDLSKIVSIKIAGTVGQSDIRVFPNPVSNGALTLVLPEAAKEAVNVRLMNVAGQVLRSAMLEAGTYTWDVRDLAPGIYTVAVEGSMGRFFEKVMISNQGGL